jgi:hypothetical protein
VNLWCSAKVVCNLNYLLSTLNKYASFFGVYYLSCTNDYSNTSTRIRHTVDSLLHGSEADLWTVQKDF